MKDFVFALSKTDIKTCSGQLPQVQFTDPFSKLILTKHVFLCERNIYIITYIIYR